MRSTAKVLAVVVGAWVGVFSAVSPAMGAAGLITLKDGNTTAYFDLDSGAGDVAWYVGETNYLARQWFWFRLGDDGPEMSVSTLGAPTVMPFDTTGEGDPDFLRLRYTGALLTVEIIYTLVGGPPPSDRADLGEIIRIVNGGDLAQDVHFFQYVDFDLSGDLFQDTVVIHGGNTATQTYGGLTAAETVVTPPPTRFQAGLYPDLLDSLDDAAPTALDSSVTEAYGDATWAFQWDFHLEPGDAFLISKGKSLVVPEPATVALMGLGLVGLLARRRRNGR